MEITVLLFATLKMKAGTNQVTVELPEGGLVSDLKEHLASIYPNLHSLLDGVIVAVNQEYAFDDDPIPIGAEVALFPPVSGGSEYPTICRIVQDSLDSDSLIRQISLKTTGAACLFSGIVRGFTQRGEPHETISLKYEAYVPMAEEKLFQVAREIRERWPLVEGIAIIQRIGLLEAGVPCIHVACTASHRDTGIFEASRYGIDRIKEIVPIWKKEINSQGEVWLEGDYHPKRGD